ncbi:imelysin family protein [Halobacteriovorax sp. HLS]|uniref:imelysin family protein n=1 Tax=Halobacteriovorax sp. HLS TaxID=2234000 RepID=UPI000FD882C2|nr:imelysin family protein [Halobacteriovorax sp. HLS]
MKNFLLISLLCLSAACGDFNTSLPDTNKNSTIEYSQVDPFTAQEISDMNSGEFEKRKLIMNIGLNVLVPATQRFYDDTVNLQVKTRLLCSAYRSATDTVELEDEIKQTWKKAMESYHYLEAMMIGPIQERDYEIRYKLYSHALTKTNTCSIDKEIVKLFDNPNYVYKESFNITGLDALEYLYHSPPTHSCSRARGNMINWSEQSLQVRNISKCAYIQRSTDYIIKIAKRLNDSWNPHYGNLTKRILENGVLGDENQTINNFSDSLFYLDKVLKDNKLAMPLGLTDLCPTASCSKSAEHQMSKFSIKAMYYNLLGFKALFNGKDYMNSRSINGFGFDDYLKENGATELKNRMNANIDLTLTKLDQLSDQDLVSLVDSMNKEDCLATTREDRKVEICAIHKDIKSISDDLKNDFLVYLALKAPRQAQGDND